MKLSSVSFAVFCLLIIPFIFFGINNLEDVETNSVYGLFCAILNLFMILNSLFFCLFTNTNRAYKVNKLIVYWIFFTVLSQIFVYFSGSFDLLKLLTDIVYVLFCPVSFLFAYKLISVNSSKYFSFKSLFVVCFIESLILYYFILGSRGVLMNLVLESSNEIYYPLLLIPWVLLMKNERVKFVFFVLLAIAILYSTKRGALLVLLLILIPYYIHLGKTVFRSRFLMVFLLIILSFSSLIVFHQIDERLDNRLSSRIESVEEDRGSGRLDIWSAVLHQQGRSSFIEWLFGHGHNSVQKYVIVFKKGYSAHNDYLQVLFDYGIFSLIVLLIFIYYRFRRLMYLYHNNHYFFFSYYSSLVLFVVLSMLSHLIKYPTCFVFIVMYWAMVESLIDKKVISRKTNVEAL